MNDYSILILDDEKDICFLLTLFLQKRYRRVDSIYSIKDLKKTDLTLYDLIFIDNNLSDGSGFEEINYIKQQHSEIKIIAISAFDTQLEKEDAKTKGANVFLGKPFNQESILELVNQMINK